MESQRQTLNPSHRFPHLLPFRRNAEDIPCPFFPITNTFPPPLHLSPNWPFGGDNPGQWSPHLSGTKLPVPCIGRMKMIAWQTQSTHVHSVSHLRKEKSMEKTAFLLHFNPPSYPPSIPHPAGLLRNPNIPTYTEGLQIKSNKSHRQRKSKGPHIPPLLSHIAWLRGEHERKGKDPGTGREE